MSAGAARYTHVAASSSLPGTGAATRSGPLSAWQQWRTAASSHRGIFRRAARSIGWRRTAWRTAKASLGAEFVRSSPSTTTASQASTPATDGVRAGPSRSMAIADFESRSSASDIPEKKRSGPTSARNAKFASRDARGDPMPITFSGLDRAAAAYSRAASRVSGLDGLDGLDGRDGRNGLDGRGGFDGDAGSGAVSRSLR